LSRKAGPLQADRHRQHDEGLATKPVNVHAGAAQKVASSLIDKGLVREIRAKADAPSGNALPDLDIKMLRQKCRGIMGKTAPPHIGKPLMVRILAYRI
jgi:hypothetical protein